MEDYELSIISTLDLGDGSSLALTACPGRKSSYSASLDSIVEWAPTAVLSLIEEREFPFGPAQFGADLSSKGIAWLRFPIRNYCTPEGNEDWPAIAGKVRDILDNKGRVLIHCWGGLGRSGMVAARLLTERGEAAVSAIHRVRQARPGAIETKAQEHWVRDAELGSV
ncbi:protein-tyrosine phosphatase family protein [Pleomorphomonas oryzae]|uniref:phosphatase domain-containing protein n=1 Tax=Pleomorphomonas oryzae TaxID=261934 RepID=UPI0003F60639|nr:protein-tyrosine phosphatase family protein [Pleomorphomonas oryzae]